MTGLDSNVLARYYIDDPQDPSAAAQREVARRLMESGEPLMVCKTVLLELEWVMRGYYDFSHAETLSAMRHLLGMNHVVVEDRDTIELALAHTDAGLDLADAIHHASYRSCDRVATFDDRKFARRAQRLALAPRVTAI